MIVFTIIGLLVFYWFCWEMGYHIAMYFDGKRAIDEVFKPVTDHTAEIISMIAALDLHKAKP